MTERANQAFLAQVEAAAPALDCELGPAVRAGFGRLAEGIGVGEIEDVNSVLPGPIRALWPQ
ncbi:MAG: hypothetical protein ACREJ5_29840 [Geminicoccaceae bacterium]